MGVPVSEDSAKRRPLKSRGSRWSRLLLELLLKTPITPNQISIASIGFAALGGWALFQCSLAPSLWCLLMGALGMQGRLICNLMDGMVAVEGNRSGRFGELYNELPDRVADTLILVGAGYGYAAYDFISISSVTLGWSGALLAVLTAYIRMCGAAVGVGHIFVGPMSKPHRMAVLTVACVLELLLLLFASWRPLVPAALFVVNVGCLVTLGRRLQRITSAMTRERC